MQEEHSAQITPFHLEIISTPSPPWVFMFLCLIFYQLFIHFFPRSLKNVCIEQIVVISPSKKFSFFLCSLATPD